MMEIKGLSLTKMSYMSNRKVLDGISLDLNKDLTIITGSPGSGKTALLETLAGLEKPDSGSISSADDIEILMQVPDRQIVHDNCAKEIGIDGERLNNIIGIVGLDTDFMSISPWCLSSGERKRLVLASILARIYYSGKGHVVLLDDPFADLDRNGRDMVINEILCNKRYTCMIAVNDLDFLDQLSRKSIDYDIFVLQEGQIVD